MLTFSMASTQGTGETYLTVFPVKFTVQLKHESIFLLIQMISKSNSVAMIKSTIYDSSSAYSSVKVHQLQQTQTFLSAGKILMLGLEFSL